MRTRTAIIAAALALGALAHAATTRPFNFDIQLRAEGRCTSRVASVQIDVADLTEELGLKLPERRWNAAVAHETGAWLESQTLLERDDAGQITGCTVHWLVPGDYPDGDTQLSHVVLGRREEPARFDTDYVTVKRRGTQIAVRTENFVAVHDTAAGGMLTEVTWLTRPATTLPIAMNDRLSSADRGAYFLRYDREPQVEVVADGPLVAKIHVRARYCNEAGNPAPGEPSAVYTFTYRGIEPTIGMTAVVSGPAGESWDELHAFEIHHQTDAPIFDQLAFGPPLQTMPFVDEPQTHRPHGGHWAALFTERHAIGLIGSRLYGIHTDLSGYGAYLHGPWQSFDSATQHFDATLYLGPSDGSPDALAERMAFAGGGWSVNCLVKELYAPADELQARLEELEAASADAEFGVRAEALRLLDTGQWLVAGVRRAAGSLASLGSWRESLTAATAVADRLAALVDGAEPPAGSPLVYADDATCVLAADRLALRFGRDDGSMVLRQIGHTFENVDYLRAGGIPADLWTITMRDLQNDATRTVRPEDAAARDWVASSEAGEPALTMVWGGCSVGETEGAVDVIVTVTMRAGSEFSNWRLRVRSHSSRYALWQVEFPRIGPVGPAGSVCVPSEWGTAWELLTPLSDWRAGYPGTECFAQMMCWWRDKVGLYFAAHDPGATVKEFAVTSRPGRSARLSVTHSPADMGVPADGHDMGYDVVLGAYDGDWYEAARIYREWATQQSWCSRGPIAEREGADAIDLEGVVTAESHAETNIAQFDGFLMRGPKGGDQVPLYPAIYGEYALTFGRPSEVNAPGALYAETGQAFVFGSTIDSSDTNASAHAENSEVAEYAKSLTEMGCDFADFLSLGEMLRPPLLGGDVPDVSVARGIVQVSAIQRSAWRAPDGRVGLFFTNVSDVAVTFTHAFRASDYDLPAGGTLRLTERRSSGRESQMQAGADQVSLEYTLASRDTLAVVLETVTD